MAPHKCLSHVSMHTHTHTPSYTMATTQCHDMPRLFLRLVVPTWTHSPVVASEVPRPWHTWRRMASLSVPSMAPGGWEACHCHTTTTTWAVANRDIPAGTNTMTTSEEDSLKQSLYYLHHTVQWEVGLEGHSPSTPATTSAWLTTTRCTPFLHNVCQPLMALIQLQHLIARCLTAREREDRKEVTASSYIAYNMHWFQSDTPELPRSKSELHQCLGENSKVVTCRNLKVYLCWVENTTITRIVL